MRIKRKEILIALFSVLMLFGFALLFLFVPAGSAETASAATSRSAVCTTQGKIESKGNVIADAPTDFYTITMESKITSGTGTLENYALIDWTYATFKVKNTDYGTNEHARYTLKRDGEVVSSNALSGRSSTTICSVELTNGAYEFTYVSTYWDAHKSYQDFPYVFHFTVDNQAPTYQLTAGGLTLQNGAATAKNITFSAEDEHFDRLYYKSPSSSTFRSTASKSYTVEAKTSNSGQWSFYAADSLGQRTETISAYMDCLPPTMTCRSGVSFGGATSKAFTVSASDAGGEAKLYVKYESEEWFTNGSRYTVPDTERNGRYYFYAEDGFGNKTDTKWVILSTEEPLGRMEQSSSDNSVSFTWDRDYWSATLDGRTYYKDTVIVEEGDHTLTLDNNAGKQKTYHFTIDHYYVVSQKQDATCKESGWVKYECLQCGDVREETLYSAGHRYGVQKAPASCTEQGENIYTCSVCGDTYREPSGVPTGHSYTSHIVKEATCTEDGINESVCDVCGDTIQTKIAAKGHNYSITNVESTDGNTRRTYTCSVCGNSYTQELGDQYENVSNYVEYLFEQYVPYMYWVLLATAGLWSIAIGVAIIIAVKNEDKAKAKKMLVNYVIGLVIIFAIVVACPYLVRGIAALVT